MPIKSKYTASSIPEVPFGDLFLENIWSHSVNQPGKVALINAHNNEQITYETLYLRINSFAKFLDQQGFGHKDVACIVAPNCWQYIVTFGAVALRGGALSGASYLFTDYELSRQFQDSGATLVVCHESVLKATLKAVAKCPKIKTLIVIDETVGRLEGNLKRFSDALKTQPDPSLKKPKIDIKKDLLLIPYSSGTTGPPKGVMISHYNVLSVLTSYQSYYEKYVWSRFDVNIATQNSLLIMPLYHVYGSTVAINIMINGGTGIIMKQFDPELFCASIQKYKIRVQMLVPPIIVFLAKSPIVEKYDLSSLVLIMSGAAPLGAEVCEEVKRRLPKLEYIAQGYGMTEMTVASHFAYIGDKNKPNYATVGVLAPNMEIMIRDIKTNKEVTGKGEGEICVRGPNIMLGYLGRPKATQETIDSNGFLLTGDIGYVDQEGCLYIVDRLKELIKVKGLQVPPAELEDLLLSHPLVSDSAVIGIKHPKDGEVPKAFIVRKNDTLSEKDVADYVAKRTAHYKHLKGGVEFIETIPRSPAGKILRRELRERNAKL